jgi:hypothetical protein
MLLSLLLSTALADEPALRRAVEQGTGLQGQVTRSVTPRDPCPPAAPELLTRIPECRGLDELRPPVFGNDYDPVCGGIEHEAYRQLVFLSTQAALAINESRRTVAAQLSRLLCVPVSEAQVTDALARMVAALCEPDASKRQLVITCEDDPDVSAAWDANDVSGRATGHVFGALALKPRDLEREHDWQRVSFVDALVHELTHGLATVLARSIPGASMEPTKKRECAVGKMIDKTRISCHVSGPEFRRLSATELRQARHLPLNTAYYAPGTALHRNEIVARNVADLVVSGRCTSTYPLFFGTGGRLRSR